MKIEPSGLTGGMFVGLKNTVAAWTAPARNMAIPIAARALATFVALFIGNGCGNARDGVGWGFIVSGVNSRFAFWATRRGVFMGRVSIDDYFTTISPFRHHSIGLLRALVVVE